MQQYEQVASFLSSKTKFRPQIGIICGSGLSGLSKSLTQTETFKYEDIPGFPQATVPGHAGELVFGMLGGIETVCMRGRFHFYEGNTMEKVVMPVKVMRLMGVKLLIVTNAAGGLNPEYNVGDIMVIQDHFGLPVVAGNTPLRGLNDDALGPRFPSVSDAYDPLLQEYVKQASEALKIGDKLRFDGTYCFMSGPQYESRAECRFLRLVGGDSVGMSTVPEVLTAKHCGMRVLGLSLITNKVVINPGETHHANHEEVLEAVNESGKYVESIVKYIAQYEVLGQYLEKIPPFEYVSKAVPCKCGATCQCGAGANCQCGCKCGPSSACKGACGASCQCGTSGCKCSATSACKGACGANCQCPKKCCGGKAVSKCCGGSSDKKCCESGCFLATVGIAVIAAGLFYVLKSKN